MSSAFYREGTVDVRTSIWLSQLPLETSRQSLTPSTPLGVAFDATLVYMPPLPVTIGKGAGPAFAEPATRVIIVAPIDMEDTQHRKASRDLPGGITVETKH